MIDPIRSNAHLLLRASLESGIPARLRIDGNSMRPTLRAGDIVMVQSHPLDRLRIGDILVLQREHDLVTHRLVAVQPDGWYTKGDASLALDPPATKETIVGLVEAIDRNGATLSTRTVGWIRTSAIIAWLAWQEAQAYRFYRRITAGRGGGVKWLAYLLVIPFRLPLWLLAAIRR